jgi:hypothetical protein
MHWYSSPAHATAKIYSKTFLSLPSLLDPPVIIASISSLAEVTMVVTMAVHVVDTIRPRLTIRRSPIRPRLRSPSTTTTNNTRIVSSSGGSSSSSHPWRSINWPTTERKPPFYKLAQILPYRLLAALTWRKGFSIEIQEPAKLLFFY